MRQAPFRFRIDQQPFTAELQTITFDLPRQMDYEGLTLRLAGNIVVTTAFTTVKTQSVYGLVRRVELLANGQTVMDQIGGYELAALTIGQTRQIAQANAAYVTAPGVTVATQPFALTLPIDRAMSDMVRPKDTNLASRDLSTLQLRITIGQLADLYTGAGVATFSACTATLFADAIQEYPDADKRITLPPYLLKRTQQDVAIASTNANLQLRLPVGNIMRRVTLVQRTTADLTVALLNNIQLIRGSDVRVNLDQFTLREHTAHNSGGALFTGVLSLDFARRRQRLGKITDCWSLGGAADVFLNMDVTASGTSPVISVITEELIPRATRSA
jgi:hypothetical protein